MIAWKITKKSKNPIPILICDWCLRVIKHPADANVISIDQAESFLIVGWMVHKDECDKAFARSGMVSEPGWWPLDCITNPNDKWFNVELHESTREGLAITRKKLGAKETS